MTRNIQVQVVNAFIAGEEGGNPAGVVLNADSYSEVEMQAIAANVGMSETAFVSQSKTEAFKLDFFTPNRRIDHCGHATIATFSYLAELGLVSEGQSSKETVDGPRKIIIKDHDAYMEQLAPKYKFPENWKEVNVTVEDVLLSVGLGNEDLDERVSPVLVNTGNNFIVIGVENEEILKNLQPNFKQISDISEKLDLIGYYIFTTNTKEDNIQATTRMFAPHYAIEEEAATGMAAGPLACVLHDFLNVSEDKIRIEQGRFMSPISPSLITAELSVDNGKITGLMVGGKGKVAKTINVEF